MGVHTVNAPHSRRAGAAMALAALPFVVSACTFAAFVGSSYLPAGDLALTELKVRDVGREPVLLGPYSRLGWNHPGPMLFYALALPYRVLGGGSGGLVVGALVINAVAVAGTLAIARRRAGPGGMVGVGLVLAALVRALGADFLRDPWNPHVTVLPLCLLVALAWELVDGTEWSLPAAVLVGSFLVQSHLGYLPVTAVVLGVAVVLRVALRAAPSRLVRPTVVAMGVATLAWLAPLVEEFRQSPGNLRAIWRYTGSADTHSLLDGVRTVSAQVAAVPDWVDGAERLSPYGGYIDPTRGELPLLLVVAVAAAWSAWRRRAGAPVALAALAGASLTAGVIAVVRMDDDIRRYLVRWTWVVGAVVGMVLALSVDAVLTGRRRRLVGGAAAAVALVLVAVSVVDAARARTPEAAASTTVDRLLEPVLASMPAGRGPVLVRPSGFEGSAIASGVVLQLEKRGFDAVVEADGEPAYGSSRVWRGEPLRDELVVVSRGGIPDLARAPDHVLVVRATELPPNRQSSYEAAQAEVDRLQQAGDAEGAFRAAQRMRPPLFDVGVFRRATR